ncbi:MAG TPA: DUF1570 domain-containing protein [Kofleriaceae bacterium]|nr:DUF1570 domain-containing protein [Kofleriaceae bacterium]
MWLGLVLGCAYPAHQRASGWILVETERIQLRTNIDRRTAERLAGEMQYMYDILVSNALPCAAKREPIAVTVLPAHEFAQFNKNDALGFYRSATVTWLNDYMGQIVLPDNLGAQSKQMFLHEVTHQLSYECFPRMPSWLSEGLAGFFETMLISSERVSIGRPPFLITANSRMNRMRSSVLDGQRLWVIPTNILPSVASIVDLEGSWRTHDWSETAPRYALAWALVDLLAVGAPDLTPRFQAYLGRLRTSLDDPHAAFKEAFGGVALQDRLNTFLRSEHIPMLYFARPPVLALDAARKPHVRDLAEEDAHLHLAWLGAPYRGDTDRERVRRHLAAAKQSPRTRDAAYLVAAMALTMQGDLAGAAREVEEGLRGAHDSAPFLEAQLDILLGGKATLAQLQQVADRLRPIATTGGQLCTLAQVAILMGDRQAALELGARAAPLVPRLAHCRPEAIAQRASQ